MPRDLLLTISNDQAVANLILSIFSPPFQPPSCSFLKQIPNKKSFLDAEEGLKSYPTLCILHFRSWKPSFQLFHSTIASAP